VAAVNVNVNVPLPEEPKAVLSLAACDEILDWITFFSSSRLSRQQTFNHVADAVA